MNSLEELKTTALTNPESVVTWLETLEGRGVKWKHSANSNQIVFKTDDYYYKAYAFDEVDKFNSLVRHAFAEVYQSYGIDWEIITIQTDKGFLDVERRQPLDVCTEWYDDILLNYSNTLRLVEEKLCFPDILKQVKEQYRYVSKIKLVRHCANKPVDYAVYNNKVILLDDADWFLYMLDEENKPISARNMFVKINLFEEDYTFTHWVVNPQKIMSLSKIYEINDKFFLFKRLDIITKESSLRNDFQKMLVDNIGLLTTNDEDSSIFEELSSIYSPFKKTFYCTNTLDGIDFLTHNKVAIRQSDIKKNKSLWDDVCYEYVNRNLCAIHLYSSLYDKSIEYLYELLNQAKLYSIEPIHGYTHTGLELHIQWNVLSDNALWEENFNYIRQHYPKVKIVVNIVLNEPFLQMLLNGDVDFKTFKGDSGAEILYGTADDTPNEFYPRRETMLEVLAMYENRIDSKTSFRIFKDRTRFDDNVKSCGHHNSDCLPYYNSNKCCICDFNAVKM